MWNRSLLLGMYQSCPECREVRAGSWRGPCWLVEECPLAPSPSDKGWCTALSSSSPSKAERRTVAQIAREAVRPGSGVIFGTAQILPKGKIQLPQQIHPSHSYSGGLSVLKHE